MKTKRDIRPYTRQFYRGNIFPLILGLLRSVLMVGSNLMVSWLLQQVLDLIAGENVLFTLPQLMLLSVMFLLLVAGAYFFAYISTPRFIARAIGQYKEFVYRRLSEKSIGAFSREDTSVYISALSNDANTIEQGYLQSIFVLLEQVLLFFGALTMMLCYSPVLTLVAILLALLPVLASLAAGNGVAKAEGQVSDANEQYMSSLKDSLVGFSVIKSFRAELRMCKLFAQKIRQVANARCKREKRVLIVEGLSAIAGVVLQIGVFLVGAYLVVSGSDLSVGTVMVFVQLLNFVINPIAQIPRCLAERRAALALIAKVATALAENVRQEGHQEKTQLHNGITVSKLSFAYEPEKPVLQDVNVTFEAGKSYAIVGASGSGKSTLLNLLIAASSGHTGSISYDDVALQDISSQALYEMVSLVQQNVFIFNASIRDNITMFSDFPKEEVDRAIALSGLTELIRQRGEDYLCGENGSGLSGGEKQRISIARSLLKKAQVLLVDEATAALDAQTAWQVSNAILALEGITRIVVTHSLEESLLRQYDCILTLKNGSIAEQGTFTQLMENKGYFYSLYTVSQ